MTSSISPPRHFHWFQQNGWALRVRKPNNRIDASVKQFIRQTYEEEKMYGRKIPVEDYVKRIRMARDSNGAKMFTTDKYLTASQVSD